MQLKLATSADFHFLSAVCSHGFFVLAPNSWHPPTQTLTTTLALDEDTAVRVTIRRDGQAGDSGTTRRSAARRRSTVEAAKGGGIVIRSSQRLTAPQRGRVRCAVARMLRLGEDLGGFHERCRATPSHLQAAELRFGRLIRSASLFEDIVKVICTCNVTWRQTSAMVQALVTHWGVPSDDPDAPSRSFPTPLRLAGVRESSLKARARVGYRARYIRQLARDVADGRLDLAAIERFDGPSDELHRQLKQIIGVGDYAAGNLCMLLGRYDRLAVDTEMVRLFRHREPDRAWTPAAMKAHYQSWQPFQFLAYWFELWHDYVQRHGQADQWWPAATGESITRPT